MSEGFAGRPPHAMYPPSMAHGPAKWNGVNSMPYGRQPYPHSKGRTPPLSQYPGARLPPSSVRHTRPTAGQDCCWRLGSKATWGAGGAAQRPPRPVDGHPWRSTPPLYASLPRSAHHPMPSGDMMGLYASASGYQSDSSGFSPIDMEMAGMGGAGAIDYAPQSYSRGAMPQSMSNEEYYDDAYEQYGAAVADQGFPSKPAKALDARATPYFPKSMREGMSRGGSFDNSRSDSDAGTPASGIASGSSWVHDPYSQQGTPSDADKPSPHEPSREWDEGRLPQDPSSPHRPPQYHDPPQWHPKKQQEEYHEAPHQHPPIPYSRLPPATLKSADPSVRLPQSREEARLAQHQQWANLNRNRPTGQQTQATNHKAKETTADKRSGCSDWDCQPSDTQTNSSSNGISSPRNSPTPSTNATPAPTKKSCARLELMDQVDWDDLDDDEELPEFNHDSWNVTPLKQKGAGSEEGAEAAKESLGEVGETGEEAVEESKDEKVDEKVEEEPLEVESKEEKVENEGQRVKESDHKEKAAEEEKVAEEEKAAEEEKVAEDGKKAEKDEKVVKESKEEKKGKAKKPEEKWETVRKAGGKVKEVKKEVPAKTPKAEKKVAGRPVAKEAQEAEGEAPEVVIQGPKKQEKRKRKVKAMTAEEEDEALAQFTKQSQERVKKNAVELFNKGMFKEAQLCAAKGLMQLKDLPEKCRGSHEAELYLLTARTYRELGTTAKTSEKCENHCSNAMKYFTKALEAPGAGKDVLHRANVELAHFYSERGELMKAIDRYCLALEIARGHLKDEDVAEVAQLLAKSISNFAYAGTFPPAEESKTLIGKLEEGRRFAKEASKSTEDVCEALALLYEDLGQWDRVVGLKDELQECSNFAERLWTTMVAAGDAEGIDRLRELLDSTLGSSSSTPWGELRLRTRLAWSMLHSGRTEEVVKYTSPMVEADPEAFERQGMGGPLWCQQLGLLTTYHNLAVEHMKTNKVVSSAPYPHLREVEAVGQRGA